MRPASDVRSFCAVPSQYAPLLLAFIVAVVLGVILLSLAGLAGRSKATGGRVKESTYESGLPLLDQSRKRISVLFFLIAIDFVIFDVDSTEIFQGVVLDDVDVRVTDSPDGGQVVFGERPLNDTGLMEEELVAYLDGELPDLDDELPDLPDDLSAEPFLLEALEAEAPRSASPAELRQRMAALLQERRFAELVALAEANSAALAADPELMTIAQVGQQRMEAEPYVQKFLGLARLALQSGDHAEVERLLVKARSLDAAHPGLVAFSSSLAPPAPSPGAPAPVAPPRPAARPAAAADAAPAPPPPPVSSPPMNETERRIHQLLQDGQTAFDGGDPQGAIEEFRLLVERRREELVTRQEQHDEFRRRRQAFPI